MQDLILTVANGLNYMCAVSGYPGTYLAAESRRDVILTVVSGLNHMSTDKRVTVTAAGY